MHVKLDIRITRVATGKYNVTTEIREENLQTRPQKIKKKNQGYIAQRGKMTHIYHHGVQGQSCIAIVYNENSSYSLPIQLKNIKWSSCQKSLEADFSGG